jgi:peptidase E
MGNNMNNYITLSEHFHYLIMNKHEPYQITFIPSASQKVKTQA